MLNPINQILAHVFGDYILQNDWMAVNKSSNTKVCVVHSILYTLPFLFLTTNIYALFIICVSHFIIDRYSITKYINILKDKMYPKKYRNTEYCKYTGLGANRIEGVKWFVYIVVDNALHIAINSVVLNWR
jgi:hypothetical protein